MRLTVTRERTQGERRVALVPESVSALTAVGLEVVVERGAGESAYFPDSAYEAAGAVLGEGLQELVSKADIWLKVRPPLSSGEREDELAAMRSGSVLVGMLQAVGNPQLVSQLAAAGVTSFSLDQLPRISRAQDMDALSAMSTVAGYHAVLMAAVRLPRFFPLLMTAAGTVTPARVLVLGAGVAGLQAIATSRRLGAVVRAFDVRPAVKEQVESLGAQFVEVGEVEAAEGVGGYASQATEETQLREREALAREVAGADVVISTALVPGRPAPKLVSAEAVAAMRPGSVVVDLAAEAGGNCELTEPGKEVEREGVWVLGPLDLPSRMPAHSSQLFSRTICRFALQLVRDGELRIDFDDQVIEDTCVTHAGQAHHPMPAAATEGKA